MEICETRNWESCGNRVSRLRSQLIYGGAGAVDFQRAVWADGVGADEDPVLPGGEAAEDARFQCFVGAEAEVGFEAG